MNSRAFSPRIMIVAGEASGDRHAADLVSALQTRAPRVEIFGLGGRQMAAAGAEVLYDLASHSVIGVAEALRKLRFFRQALALAGQLLRQRRPDLLVLIDLPDFNFRVGHLARKAGVPVVYYISPQIWAWRAGRINTMRAWVRRMLVLFPFELPIYEQAGIPVSFVGHPLLDIAKPECDPAVARSALLAGAAGPLVAMLPGSRRQEIELLLPPMARAGLALQREFPGLRFFIPKAPTVAAEHLDRILQSEGLRATVVTETPYAARAAADLALVASGTATLETAILKVPMLIVYSMHPLSHWLARRFVKLPYFGLANIVAGKKIAPEFLQRQVTGPALAQAAAGLLRDPNLQADQRQGWERVRQSLGGPGAAGRAADLILKELG